MLKTGDFSRIPGFLESNRSLLRKCMTQFIHDVDEEYKDVVQHGGGANGDRRSRFRKRGR
jgi:hypothetical protein